MEIGKQSNTQTIIRLIAIQNLLVQGMIFFMAMKRNNLRVNLYLWGMVLVLVVFFL